MKQSEILWMDWEQSMTRVHAILVAVCLLCDDIGDDMDNKEQVETIWNLAELAQAIVKDQLMYSLEQEKKETRTHKKKNAVNHVPVVAENNHGYVVDSL